MTIIKHTFPVLQCEFVEGTSLVPEGWESWFWSEISDNAPFSWGDNNRTMVTACDFRRHCAERLSDVADEGIPQEDINQFLEALESLGNMYVDLEN